MSNMLFDREDFVKSVPEEILTRTKENMEEYHMTLCDAFQEAVKELAVKGTELWNAWYYDDFRAYIPCIYEKQYLDFEKYPLKYNVKRLFVDMDGTLAVFQPVDTLETLYEEGYFLNLEPHRNVVEAVKEIVNNYPDIEVFIMSAYLSDSKYALKEKNEWLDAYLPEIDAAHRIFPPCGTDKKEYVPGEIKEDDYLWDDYTKNLSLWEPPARGIKLLNGINHTNGTWQKDCLSYEKSGEELAKNINEIMMSGICIKDKTPREKVMRPWQSSYYDYRLDTDAAKLVAVYEYVHRLYASATYTRYDGYEDLWEVKWGVTAEQFKERVNFALAEFEITYDYWKSIDLAQFEKFDDIINTVSKKDMPPSTNNKKKKEDKRELLNNVTEHEWPYENFLDDIFASGFKMEDIFAAEILEKYIDYWFTNVTGMTLTNFTGLTKEEREILCNPSKEVESLNILRSKEANYLQQKNAETTAPRKRGR